MKKKWSIVVFFAALFFISSISLSLACDFCLLSQGISHLETISGAGGIKIKQKNNQLKSIL